LSEAEIQRLVLAGAEALSLGKRILRTETATIAALSLIQGALGELGTC
jgi:16S rRNA (uracil1498-N3)-methyltransferase